MNHSRLRATVAAATLALVAACGGGGSSSNTAPPPTGGISGTGFAAGIITGFGSIIVNGTHYDISSATITSDGITVTENTLKIGDYVIVTADIMSDGSREARSVELEEAVEGLVFSASPQSGDTRVGSINVMGQTVIVSANTTLDNFSSLDVLVPGTDCVEVYGLPNPLTSSIDASRIERKTDCTNAEVKGVIDSADTGAQTFVLGGLTVDYSSAQLFNFGSAVPAAGQFVEAKAPLQDINLAGSSMLASSVELKTGGISDDVEDNDEAEVEGYISGCPAGGCASFMVGGVQVQVDQGTQYTPAGFSQADIIDGVKTEVEGSFSGGILIADEMEFRSRTEVRIEATIDEVAGDTIYLLGDSGSSAGIMVNISETTRIETQAGGLVAGDFVMVNGTETPDGSDIVEASRIEQDDPESRVLLQGIVDAKDTSAAGFTLTILGKTVSIDSGATSCEGLNEQPVNCASLVDGIVTGQTIVKAQGTWDAVNMILDTSGDEVSLED
jgi:hypothetical protein